MFYINSKNLSIIYFIFVFSIAANAEDSCKFEQVKELTLEEIFSQAQRFDCESEKNQKLIKECSIKYHISIEKNWKITYKPKFTKKQDIGSQVARTQFEDLYGKDADVVVMLSKNETNRFGEKYAVEKYCGWVGEKYKMIEINLKVK